ncbi:ComEA family DNA-binding protein [Arthrobacter zhaoguopingii]|uniref:ComEA family DNA-binding protein n=1 Tax=Arthrobacter zhaoguopingii TaxID=2681491 RepID=UPI001357E1D1|nr:ComEA family DNA-binding protein [Arthrobacter zhaoguopingii]
MPRHRWATTAPVLPLPPPADRSVDSVDSVDTDASMTGEAAGASHGPGGLTKVESEEATPRTRRWAAACGASLVFLALALTLGAGLFFVRSEASPPVATIPLSAEEQRPGSGDELERGGQAAPGSAPGSAAPGSVPADGAASGTAGSEGDSAGGSGAGTPLEGDEGAELGGVFVHLSGAVASPGVREVPQGSRLFQVIDLAGGATPEADLDAVNLAAVVVDGGQVHVPRKGEAVSPGPPAGTGGSTTGDRTPGSGSGGAGPGGAGTIGTGMPDGMVNLNTADAPALESLPRVGPVLAERIIAWRTEHGPFARPEDLEAVPGIGPALLEAMLPLVVVR